MLDTTAPTAPSPTRSAWQSRGGGALALAAVLLLAATLLEHPLLTGAQEPALRWAFVIGFVASTVTFAAAAIGLAHGSDGTDGIVGGSRLGRVALITFGMLWLAGQLASLLGRGLVGSIDVPDAASTALLAISHVCGLVAAIVIVRARVAAGAARWMLLVLVGVGIVVGIVAGSTDSATLVTTVHVASTLVQLATAVIYLRRGADTTARTS